MSETETTTSIHYCFYHPNVETELRCNKCGKYICSRDAIRTPVGYRCKDCVHSQQDIFYNALPADYVIAAVITLPISFIAGQLASRISWLAIFVGLIVGQILAEVVHRAVKKRRGRYTWAVVLGCFIAGTLLALMPTLQILFSGRLAFVVDVAAPSIAIELAVDAAYLVLGGGTIIARLKYGK